MDEPTSQTDGTSKGEVSSQGAHGEETPKKKQEGTIEWFQSQKDKLEKQLNEKETVWSKERQELSNQLQNVLSELKTIKNPPKKEEALEPPQKPKVAFVDDVEAWNNYYEAKSDYDRKQNAKLSEQLTSQLRGLEEKLTAKEKEQEAVRNLEAVKSYSKSVWMQEGLTAEEAEECWNFQAGAKGEDKLKALAKMFKVTKGNGSNVKEIMDDRRKQKMDGVVPGAGAGGGAMDTINPNEFTKTVDRNSMYKKQT